MTIYLNTSLEYLQHAGLLTERAFSALYMRRVRTVGELMGRRNKGWLNRHNYSMGALMDIEAFLNKLDSGSVDFRRYSNSKDDDAKRIPLANPALIDAREAHAFNRAYVLMAYENISQLGGAAAELMRELFPDARSMCNAILNKSYDVLTIHRDLGRTGNIELRRLLLHHLKVMRKYIFKSSILDEKPLYVVGELIRVLSSNISTFDDEVVIHDFLSVRQRRYLASLFRSLSDGLSPAAREYQQKHLPMFSDAMKMFGLPEAMLAEGDAFMPDRSVLHEVWDMVQALEDAFSNEAYSDKDVKLQARMAYAFPWLLAADHRFVFRFYQDNDSVPLFYVMLQLLRNSRVRALEIYALVNGVKDGIKHKLEDVAAEKALTRERVRQLFEKGYRISKDTIERYISWGDYTSLMDSNYITALSPKYRMIQEVERLPEDFGVFCALLTVLGDFEMIRIGEKIVAVHRRIRPYVYVKHIRNQLIQICQKRHSEDAVFDLHTLVADIPETLREDVFRIVCLVATTYTDIPFDEDWKVAIKQNYVDITREVFKILEANGHPMSLEDIFTQFKQRYPSHKYTEPEQLRLWILKHEDIKPVGKTSTYGLTAWQHVYYGNIRDLLRQTLEASSRPIHINLLEAIAKQYFPTTNAKSISSSMSQDVTSTFVAFRGGFFGLSSKVYSSKYKTTGDDRRYTFSERLRMLTQFITAYHRFPFSSGGDTEQGLQRWLYNAENDLLDLTRSQKSKLKAELAPFRDAHLPENETEERFLETCEEYKAHIENEYDLPTRRDNPELYDWMRRSKDNYNSYIDNRRHYLTELFNYIHSLGFDI